MSEIVTLTPTTPILAQDDVVLVGGTLPGVITDSNDATLAALGEFGKLVFNLTDYTVPANKKIARIRLVTRMQSIFGDYITVLGILYQGYPNNQKYIDIWGFPDPIIWNSPVTRAGPWFTKNPQDLDWTQTLLNGVQVGYLTIQPQNNGAFVLKSWLEVDVRTQPTVNSVTTPTGAQSTRRPTVAWTQTIPSGDQQGAYRVKIFKQSVYSAGGFNAETSTDTAYDSGVRAVSGSAITSHVPTADIAADGNFKAYVSTATKFNDTYYWSTYVAGPVASITDTVGVPTAIKPVQGATVTTNFPTLGATVSGLSSKGARSKIEWQLATNAGFSSNVKSVIEPDSQIRSSGASTIGVPNDSALFQTTWYVRARMVSEYGTAGAWSAYNSFTVAHPPQATNLQPTAGAYVQWDDAGTVHLDWNFTDASSDDAQTAYEVIIERNDTGATLSDTGKVTSSVTDGPVSLSSAYLEMDLRFKVRLWDNDDVTGGYSATSLFRAGLGPSVTPITPIDGYTVDIVPTFTWDFDAPGTRYQKKYRIVVVRTTGGWQIVHDSGWKSGQNTSYSLPNPAVLRNNMDYFVTFWVEDSVGFTDDETSVFSTDWVGPDLPLFTVDTATFDTHGFVGVYWSGDLADPDWVYWRVLYREFGETEWTTFIDIDEAQPYYLVPMYALRGGTDYEFVVVQAVQRGDEILFSDDEPQIWNPGTGEYWLLTDAALLASYVTGNAPLDADDAPDTLSMHLFHVTEDTFTDDVEQEQIDLINRGRKVEYGTVFGHKGALTAQLWDVLGGELTARQQREQLEEVCRRRTALTLRTPFGELWNVSPSEISFTREPGAGVEARGKVTMQYVEVT